MAGERGVVDVYRRVFDGLPQPVNNRAAFDYLDDALPPLWERWYGTRGARLSTVTLGGKAGEDGAFSYLFDEQSKGSNIDGRLVAAWGLSRAEPANTRDTGRIAGLLSGIWSQRFPGRDRGHVFAHTMGGGMDINLFPQLASVNRGGIWRQMEKYAVANPGTFCFVRPLYRTASWTPDELEYGLFKLPPNAPGLWVEHFNN
jgi:hypothetical protein